MKYCYSVFRIPFLRFSEVRGGVALHHQRPFTQVHAKEMALHGIIRNRSMLKILTNGLASANSSSTPLLVENLRNRAFLRVVGNEVREYLQGLITNDMNNFDGASECMYAMLLNGKGRVLYDTIIYRTDAPNTYMIEGDSSALDSLKKHLLMYKVRRKIGVESADDFNLWVINNDHDLINTCSDSTMKSLSQNLKYLLNNCLICCDPRIPNLGVRILAPKDVNVTSTVEALPGYQVITKNFYKSLRYKLGIGEGVEELTPGQCFPLEANGDYLNGISFQKGCYIGQELTARTYHAGVVRKRLMPLTFVERFNLSEKDIPLFLENGSEKAIGKLKGAEGNSGLALLRIQEVLKSPKLRILDKSCTTLRPFWWPPSEGYSQPKKAS